MSKSKTEVITGIAPDVGIALLRLDESIRERFVEEIEQVLESYSDSEVAEAVRCLIRTDSVPKQFGKIPYAIRDQIVKRQAAIENSRWQRIADGQETVKCVKCGDTGIRTTWTPEALRIVLQAYKNGDFEPPTFPCGTKLSFRCQCESGRRFSWLRIYDENDPPLPELTTLYDENGSVVAIDSVMEIEQQRLALQWIAEKSGKVLDAVSLPWE